MQQATHPDICEPGCATFDGGQPAAYDMVDEDVYILNADTMTQDDAIHTAAYLKIYEDVDKGAAHDYATENGISAAKHASYVSKYWRSFSLST